MFSKSGTINLNRQLSDFSFLHARFVKLLIISSNAQSFLSNEKPPELMSGLFGGGVGKWSIKRCLRLYLTTFFCLKSQNLGFMAGVWISGGVTGLPNRIMWSIKCIRFKILSFFQGTHINPAVTLALACTGKCKFLNFNKHLKKKGLWKVARPSSMAQITTLLGCSIYRRFRSSRRRLRSILR